MTEAQKELWEKIEDVRTAMLTTVELDGSFRSRPMWTQGDEFDGTLWFFASDESPLVDELERSPRVGLSYGAPDKDLYLSVSGRAELVRDEAKAEGAVERLRAGLVPRRGGRSAPRPPSRRRRAGAVLGGQETEGAAVRGDRSRRRHRQSAEERRREEARLRRCGWLALARSPALCDAEPKKGVSHYAVRVKHSTWSHSRRLFLLISPACAACETSSATWLDSIGASGEQRDAVVLAIHEAAANAIEHANGQVTVRGARDRDRLLLVVSNTGPWKDRDRALSVAAADSR